MSLFDCIEYIRKEGRVLKEAPLVLAMVFVFGVGVSAMYYSDRVDLMQAENARLSQALGIERPEVRRPLIRLTNNEIRKKGINAVTVIRSIVSYHQDQEAVLNSKLRKREVTETHYQELLKQEKKRAEEELTARIKVEALMILDELGERCPGTIRKQLKLPRINPSDNRESSVSMYRMFPLDVDFIAPSLADDIDELVKSLSDK